jgi:RecT family
VTAVERFTASALDVVRDQMAPGATDAELVYFAMVCNRLDLSPFADQIVLVGRYDKAVGRRVFRHQITVAGRRTLAARTGRLAGIEGPVWCGPRNPAGDLVWSDVWDDDTTAPYCARVLVHVAGWVVPANGTAKWSEFAQTDKDGRLVGLWGSMPAHMLAKCAESIALRRAFPDTLTADVVAGFDDVELGDVDAEQIVGSGPTVTPAGPDPTDYRDQGTAHRIVATMPTEARESFCNDHGVVFGDRWPDDVVADALDLEAAS